jgi:DNA-binding beta-propeller fold protein YncE
LIRAPAAQILPGRDRFAVPYSNLVSGGVIVIRGMLISLSFAVVANAAASEIEFKRLPVVNSIHHQALTEDGQYLVLGHKAEDSISILDTATLKVVKEVECRQPTAILCRGDRVLVANYGEEGTISVFSRKENWDQVDEVEVGQPNPEMLSAPGGTYFKGAVIVKCRGDGRYAIPIMAVDVNNDRHAEITKGHYSTGTVDYMGKYFFTQGTGGSPSHEVGEVFDFPALAKGNRVVVAGRSWNSAPILYQVSKGPFWFGGDYVFKGMPPRTVGDAHGHVLIPDRMVPACYAFDNNTITCKALDGAMTELGSVQMIWPEKHNPKVGPIFGTDRSTQSHKHLAATIGGKLHFFLWSAHERCVYHGTAAAFDVQQQQQPPEVAGGPTEVMEPSGTPGEFPARVAVGKLLEHRLAPEGTKGEFRVLDAPKGVRISDDGLLTWKPAKTDIGVQRLKIRMIVGGKSKFLRVSTEVVDLPAMAKVDPSPRTGGTSRPDPTVEEPAPKLEDLGIHSLNTDKCFLSYGIDGHSLLLSDGESIRVLDKTGMVVTASHACEKMYRAVYERAAYYVALAAVDLDLIDKKTGAVSRSIPLEYSRIQTLAIHPTKVISYVSIQNPSKTEDFAERNPVLEIDETTGKVRELPEVRGLRVAADPNGRYLFTSSNETYKTGVELDLRMPSGVRETFSNRDVVIAYDLTGSTPRLASRNDDPGKNGQRLVVAPDGRHVSYVAGGGAPGHGYSIAALAADDVSRESSRYQIAAYPRDIAYHPSANLVACTNGGKIWMFDRRTGERQDGRLGSYDELKDIRRLLFAPDGSRLMVAHQHPERGRVIQSIPVKLTDSERVAIAAAGGTAAAPPPKLRTWTDRTGKFRIQAELVSAAAGKVKLRKTDGREIVVPADRLSEADQDYVREQGERP